MSHEEAVFARPTRVHRRGELGMHLHARASHTPKRTIRACNAPRRSPSRPSPREGFRFSRHASSIMRAASAQTRERPSCADDLHGILATPSPGIDVHACNGLHHVRDARESRVGVGSSTRCKLAARLTGDSPRGG